MFQENQSNTNNTSPTEVANVVNEKDEKPKQVKMSTEKLALVPKPRTQKVTKLVPPDGGWGWMVLIGTAMSNVSTITSPFF